MSLRFANSPFSPFTLFLILILLLLIFSGDRAAVHPGAESTGYQISQV